MRTAALLALALLGGCAATETPAERQARLQQSCAAAGFDQGSDSYRLCLLIERQNDQLADLERRLAFIETDTRRLPYYGRYDRY